MINSNYYLLGNVISFQSNKEQKANSQASSLEYSNAYACVPLYAYRDKLISLQTFTSSDKNGNNVKGSNADVAQKLKALNAPLDKKLAKAKDIILTDLGLPCGLLVLVDRDCGPGAYAGYSPTTGVIAYNKALCQKKDSQFSDDAVLCILRHEIDHMVVFTKLYKTLGPDGFEKLMQNSELIKQLPPEQRVVNHKFYQEMSKYVDKLSDSDTKKYADAITNYNKNADSTGIEYSNYRKFTFITNNFDNELENSARNVQYQLEEQMGVTTLKDFYSMIDHTKALKTKLKQFINQNPSLNNCDDSVEMLFDYLYHKSSVEAGFEDKTQNWGRILTNAEGKVNTITQADIENARKYRAERLAASKNNPT